MRAPNESESSSSPSVGLLSSPARSQSETRLAESSVSVVTITVCPLSSAHEDLRRASLPTLLPFTLSAAPALWSNTMTGDCLENGLADNSAALLGLRMAGVAEQGCLRAASEAVPGTGSERSFMARQLVERGRGRCSVGLHNSAVTSCTVAGAWRSYSKTIRGMRLSGNLRIFFANKGNNDVDRHT